ncbi:hypothetical protein CQ054_07005 [Ochrobactrum sp. MYb29]|nr:hypothetical protein CQ054_07005 [Ochrobactrum sp. MYb29]
MPEAVTSNSIHAPIGQPSSSIELDLLHDTIREGEALNVMLGALLDQQSNLHADISFGVCNLMRGLIATLRDIHHSASTQRIETKPAPKANEIHGKPIYAVLSNSLRSRIQGMTADIWRECHPHGDETSATNIQFVSRIAQHYTGVIMQQLADKDDALEAGSFLPWAEIRIRAEVARDAGIQFSDIEYAKSLLTAHNDALSSEARSKIESAAS